MRFSGLTDRAGSPALQAVPLGMNQTYLFPSTLLKGWQWYKGWLPVFTLALPQVTTAAQHQALHRMALLHSVTVLSLKGLQVKIAVSLFGSSDFVPQSFEKKNDDHGLCINGSLRSVAHANSSAPTEAGGPLS